MVHTEEKTFVDEVLQPPFLKAATFGSNLENTSPLCWTPWGPYFMSSQVTVGSDTAMKEIV